MSLPAAISIAVANSFPILSADANKPIKNDNQKMGRQVWRKTVRTSKIWFGALGRTL